MFDSVEENQVYADPESATVRNTEWYNPTEDTVVLELHVETPSNTRKVFKARGDRPLSYRESTGNVKYMIPPKKSEIIPSEFDNAVQVIRDGVIQSGLGPQLIKKGVREAPKMHHALDVERAEKKAALTEAQMAFKAQAESEAKLAQAMARLAELEKLIAAPTAAAVALSPAAEETAGRQFVQPPNKHNK